MKTLWLVILFAAFCALPLANGFAAEISAGVARVEITPPAGHPMGGYAARKGPSTGVHDPLYATVLLLKADGATVAIVSCDLRSFPSELIINTARQRKLADHVLIAVTHNRSGPMTWEDQSWPSRGRRRLQRGIQLADRGGRGRSDG